MWHLFIKTKHSVGGKVQKHKERLVARVFTQQLGEDHSETFVRLLNDK